jgi:predicted nucleotidyltransferase
VKTLKDMNLVKIEITKSINFISFNRDEELAIKLKRVQNIKQIYLSELMNYLETEFTSSTISLFGSFSRGEDTVSSDIDIAVIGRKDKLLHLEKYEKMLNRKININFYSSFKDIHVHLRNNILGGILFYGVIEL